jgi:hypothetical protein
LSTGTDTGNKHWLLRELPYVAMLALAIGGVILTGFRGPATYAYWMALAPIYGFACIVTGWREIDKTADHMWLVATQALHWLAFLGAMWLMFLPEVRGVVNDNATSLALLILLALGTFVAGVHARAWRICLVGLVLAVSLPVVAWIQDSAMLLLVGALMIAAIAGLFWWLRRRETRLP